MVNFDIVTSLPSGLFQCSFSLSRASSRRFCLYANVMDLIALLLQNHFIAKKPNKKQKFLATFSYFSCNSG